MSGANKRTYRGRAKSWGLGEAGTGREQVAVEFEVLTEGAPETSVVWYGYFTEATADRTIEALRYCGWTGDDLTDLTGLDANEVDLVVEDEEYEGRTYAKVQWVNKPGGLALKAPLTPERAKSFAASMREKIRALDASKGERKNTPAPRPAAKPASRGGAVPPEPPPLTDADIPF